uniref:DUF834 domain-containing protein n=1 Tax=Oryza punctata TaxID=4537 RepID=A0A0E0JKA5_ORYPU
MWRDDETDSSGEAAGSTPPVVAVAGTDGSGEAASSAPPVVAGAERQRDPCGRGRGRRNTPPVTTADGSPRETGGEKTGYVREGKTSLDPPLPSPSTADPHKKGSERRWDPCGRGRIHWIRHSRRCRQ